MIICIYIYVEIRTNLQYILANPGTPLPIIEKSKQEKSKTYKNSGFYTLSTYNDEVFNNFQ